MKNRVVLNWEFSASNSGEGSIMQYYCRLSQRGSKPGAVFSGESCDLVLESCIAKNNPLALKGWIELYIER